MYDWLLFLHLLAAFALAVTVVTYSAVALGAPADGRALTIARTQRGSKAAGRATSR